MRVLNKSILLMLTCSLLLSASCGKKTETSSMIGDNPQIETIASDNSTDSSEKQISQDTRAKETAVTDDSDHSEQSDEVSDTGESVTGTTTVENPTDEEGVPVKLEDPEDVPEDQPGEDPHIEAPGGIEAPVVSEDQPVKNIEDCEIYVTIHSVDISLNDLKENQYVVPVYITLDKNAGINYTEWGVYYDPRCTVEAVNNAREKVDFNTVTSINENQHFIWTAWAASNGADYDGTLLKLNVTLPSDAALGDSYPITYANMSLADKPHVWNSNEENWVASDSVGWQSGVITITETSALYVPDFYGD